MLLPRVLTALVGIPLILFLIQTGGPAFAFFIFTVSMLCLHETFALFEQIGPKPRRLIGYPLGAVLFVAFVLPSYAQPALVTLGRHPALLGSVLTLAVVILTGAELFYIRTRSLMSSAGTLFAVIFCTWPLAHLVLLRDLVPGGDHWCLFLFIGIWVSDTMAYFVGTMLGKNKLAPKISPKKTIEGLLGSIIGGVASSSVLWLLFLRQEGISYAEVAILGGLGIGLVGQLSDLVESVLKREAKVKDSSSVLPGHGGILDRFDSFLLTTPLLYYYLALKP